MLKSALERAVPRTLWTIDRREKACVPPPRVKVFGKRVKVTPPIACTIVGKVTRGALRLRGEGQEIVVDVPLHAALSASDDGGVLKAQTTPRLAIACARDRTNGRPGTSGNVRISDGGRQCIKQ